MPFSSNSVTEVFASATVSNGNLTIPSGSIVSYIPLSATNPGVSEMIFGLLDTMAEAVATGNLANIVVNQAQTLSGSTLTKRYTFSVNLDVSGNQIDEILNVRPEAQS